MTAAAADALDTEVTMSLVCYRSSRNATNCPYFPPMFRLMNWNVRQIDCWFVRNCIRSTVGWGELDLFALVIAAAEPADAAGGGGGGDGRIKYLKICLMNPKKIAGRPERIAIGIDRGSVAAEMMTMRRMIRDQMKKQKSKNSITEREKKRTRITKNKNYLMK